MRNVVVAGVGIHPFGRFEAGYRELGAHAGAVGARGVVRIPSSLQELARERFHHFLSFARNRAAAASNCWRPARSRA